MVLLVRLVTREVSPFSLRNLLAPYYYWEQVEIFIRKVPIIRLRG